MEFALLPPGVDSGRMDVGLGSGQLLAAATAWDALAAQLHTAAQAGLMPLDVASDMSDGRLAMAGHDVLIGVELIG